MFTTPTDKKDKPREGWMTPLITIVEHIYYSYLSKYNLPNQDEKPRSI